MNQPVFPVAILLPTPVRALSWRLSAHDQVAGPAPLALATEAGLSKHPARNHRSAAHRSTSPANRDGWVAGTGGVVQEGKVAMVQATASPEDLTAHMRSESVGVDDDMLCPYRQYVLSVKNWHHSL